MKYLFTLLLLFPLFLVAQGRTSIDFFGAHGFSYEPNSFLASLDLEDNYSPINVSRFGVGGTISLGHQVYLRSGVQFSQYGSRWSGELRWGTQHVGDGGFDPTLDPGLPTYLETQGRDYYVEAMIAGGYKLRTQTAWKPFVELGIGAGKYLTSASRGESDIPDFYPEGIQFTRIEWYHSISYLGRAALGTNYAFNDRFGIYGMAVYQKHLRTINETGSAIILPWQATLELGVQVFVGKRNLSLKKP